ncbi:MAG: hypothetical protein ACLR2O_12085 [Coprococcus sp.]
MMLIFYTDIKNSPVDVYEAASIDGAGPAENFSVLRAGHYTYNFIYNLITSIISSFQQVTLVMLLTEVDQQIYLLWTVYTYNNAFQTSQTWICQVQTRKDLMFIIILLLTAVVFKSSIRMGIL